MLCVAFSRSVPWIQEAKRSSFAFSSQEVSVKLFYLLVHVADIDSLLNFKTAAVAGQHLSTGHAYYNQPSKRAKQISTMQRTDQPTNLTTS